MEFRIGDVATRTFGAISRNLTVFIALSGILVGVPAAFIGLWQVNLDPTEAPGAVMGAGILAALVSLVTQYVLQGAIVHGAVVDFNGGRAKFNDCLATGFRHAGSLFVIALLMSLGIMLGMIVLIIPGLILAIMWSVAVPAQIVEDTGVTGSLGRSRELTRGNRWRVFAVLLIFLVVSILISVIVAVPAAIFSTPEGAQLTSAATAATVVANMVATMLSTVVAAVGAAAIYFELRRAKEGIGAEALAKVFE